MYEDRQKEKTMEMSATISKRKMSQFNNQPQKTPTVRIKEKKTLSTKDVVEAQRSMDIAKERGIDIKQILAHDLLPVLHCLMAILSLTSTSHHLIVKKILHWISHN